MPDEGQSRWFILLINKARVGDHRLLKRLSDHDAASVREFRRQRWADPAPVRTRSYRAAASFAGRDGACDFLRLCGYLPPGYLAEVVEILPPPPRRLPAKRRLMTPYGPVTLLEGQACLFGEGAADG